MWRLRKFVALSLLALFSLVLVFSGLEQHASGQEPGWFSGTPSVQKIADVSTAQRLAKQNCTNMTLTVHRQIWNGDFGLVTEDHCMVSTFAGLIDSNGQIIQPVGFNEAFLIKNYANGGAVLVPVPHQASVLSLSPDPSSPGVNVGVYYNLFDHLKLNSFSKMFELNDQPNFTLKYANGRPLALNIPGTLTFSDDGRYFAADVVFGSFVRVDLDTLRLTQFEQTLPIANGSGLQNAAVSMDSTGQFAAVGYNGATGWGGTTYLRIVDINSCGNETSADQYVPQTLTCQVVDNYPVFSAQSTNINGIDGLSFATDHTLLVDSINKDNTRTRYAVTAAGTTQRATQYLAMGDSYISGEGAFSYRDGTDTGSNACHQSLLSYPYLLSAYTNSFEDVACSGAVIDNVLGNDPNNFDTQLIQNSELSLEQKNNARKDYLPGVILQRDFLSDNPQTITVSVGGNDIGFKQILETCVLPFEGDITPNTDCYTTYEERKELVNTINAQFNNLVSTYQTLKGNDLERKVYVIGYPQIMSTTGSCGDNVRFSQPEREFANQLITYLDSVIQQAAHKAGVAYVDTQHALDGHKLCEASGGALAVNGLTAGDDNAVGLGNESYHPNALGHQLLANTISAATYNFSLAMPTADDSVQNPVASDDLDILQAPKEQAVQDLVFPVQTNALQVLEPGTSSSIDISETHNYLAPSSAPTVLHSTPVNLEALQVDASGEIRGAVTIPAGTTPGFHTLHIYAHDIAGNPVDVQKVVYVSASPYDYDGDGILNGEDSCPSIPNSGHDVDQDGIDDACDGAIGEAPASATQTSGSPSQQPSSTFQVKQALLAATGVTAEQPIIQSADGSVQPAVAMANSVQNVAAISSPSSNPVNVNSPNKRIASTAVHGPHYGAYLAIICIVLTAAGVLSAMRKLFNRK